MAAASIRVPRNLGMAWFKILGANTRGTGPTILLVVEKNRYLINCEESLHRLFIEANFNSKIKELRGIFLTRPLWDRFSSIYNYTSLRFLSETGEKGTPDFKLFSANTDSICGSLLEYSEKAEYSKIDVSKSKEVYEDKEILIEPILIQKVTSGSTMPATKKPHLKSTSIPNEDLVVAYYGELGPILGKVDIELVEKCGIKKHSKLIGDLVRGETVVSQSGRVVRPEECVGPQKLGASFLIIECPNKEFLTPILKCERLESLRNSKDRILKVVIHLVPQSVVETPEYLEWMKSFHSKTEHLIVLTNRQNRLPTYGYKLRCIINLVSPSLYPIRKHDEEVVAKIPGLCENMQIVNDSCHFFLHRPSLHEMETKPSLELARIPNQAEVMQDIYTQIEQSFELSKIRVYKQFPVNTTENVNKQLTHLTPLQHYKEFTEIPPNLQLTPKKGDPIVVFLGTAASVSTAHRNTSCILIIDADKNSYMLDCGDGAYSQLYARFGELTNEILARLKVIFVSHRHTDHLSGLIRLLEERDKVVGERDKKVLVLGPTKLSEKLRFYSNNCSRLNYDFIQHRFTERGLDRKLLKELSLRELQGVRVRHCFDSFGVSIVHEEGWKMVYSGDTRPVDALVAIGMGCDLLIHEATFETGLEEHAKFKKHSTTQEAIEIGHKMGAKFTILTHFSTRYSRLPKFEEAFVSQNVAVAFDMMTVQLSHLPNLVEAQKCIREIVPKFLKHTRRSENTWETMDSWDPYDDEEMCI